MKRRLSIVMLALFCVLVEVFSVYGIVALKVWPYNHWLVQTVSTLAAGRPVPPDNDGPIDYRVFWSVGHMVAAGQGIESYDPSKLLAYEKRHNTISPISPWYYPPTLLFLMSANKIVSFGAGFLLWNMFLLVISCLILRSASIPWAIIGATVISPAALWNDTLGQFGLISGALLIASLLALSRRPTRAGIFAGFLTIKPQVGLLLPVIFLARRSIRAIVAALLVFLLLVAVSLVLFGPGVWWAFFTSGLAAAHAVLVEMGRNFGLFGGISVFWFARTLGLGVSASYVVQVLAAFAAMIWCWRAWRDQTARLLPRVALTTCLATFLSPYGYVYDLCAYSAGITLLAWDRGRLEVADVLLWALPLQAFILAGMFHVLLTPVIILLAAIRAHRQMRWGRPEGVSEWQATLEAA